MSAVLAFLKVYESTVVEASCERSFEGAASVSSSLEAAKGELTSLYDLTSGVQSSELGYNCLLLILPPLLLLLACRSL